VYLHKSFFGGHFVVPKKMMEAKRNFKKRQLHQNHQIQNHFFSIKNKKRAGAKVKTN
jgi:hypothetical protein